MIKYTWEGINFLSEKYRWKKIKKYNVSITLNVLCAIKEKMYSAYVSKHNSNRQ